MDHKVISKVICYFICVFVIPKGYKNGLKIICIMTVMIAYGN